MRESRLIHLLASNFRTTVEDAKARDRANAATIQQNINQNVQNRLDQQQQVAALNTAADLDWQKRVAAGDNNAARLSYERIGGSGNSAGIMGYEHTPTEQKSLGLLPGTTVTGVNTLQGLQKIGFDPRNPTGYIAPGAVIGGAAKATNLSLSQLQAQEQDYQRRKAAGEFSTAQGGVTHFGDILGTEADQRQQAIRKLQEQAAAIKKSGEKAQRDVEQAGAATQGLPGQGLAERAGALTQSTRTQLDGLDNMLSGLSPSVVAMYKPLIELEKQRILNAEQSFNDQLTTFQTDAQIEGQYDFDKQRALTLEQKLEGIAKENRDIQLRAAEYSKSMIEADRDMMKMQAIYDQQDQIRANIEGEKKLRRRMNALGINTDSAGLEYLDSKIAEGQKAVKRIQDVADMNTVKYNLAITEGYKLDVSKALSGYESSIINITATTDEKLSAIKNSINLAKKERDDAIRTALKEKYTAFDNAAKEAGNTVEKAITLAYQQKKDADARAATEAAQKRDDAYKFFNFAFTDSTDPAMRVSAVNAMRNAGYDIPSDVDMNADPISFQLKMLETAAKSSANSATDPFRFKGEDAPQKQALAASALTVIGQLEGGVELNKAQLSYVNQLLDRGEIETAKSHIRGLAVAALKGAQETAYSARSTIVAASDQLLPDLRAIRDTKDGEKLFNGLKDAYSKLEGKDLSSLSTADFNIYNKAIQDLKTKFAVAKDPAIARIFSRVENIAGLIINERYGAAVTDGEMARAREYIAMSGNTLSDTIIKLDEFARFSEMQNEKMLNTKMGIATGESSPPPLNTPTPTDDDFNSQFRPKSSPQAQLPKVGERLSSGFVSGVVTGYGSKYWKPGLDVFAPAGSPITTPRKAVVEKVVNEYRTGYPNNVAQGKAQNGGFGNQVVAKYDDGVKLQFSHLKDVSVKPGDVLEPGKQLASIGNTGNTYGKTGIHVDITGYKPDGTLMTAQEVAQYMLSTYA